MTGGRVVVLGATGRNFAAGMSGGIAYVLDRDGTFASRCNHQLVGLEELAADDEETVQELLREHLDRTGSTAAAAVLADWDAASFVKVMPHDYKRALSEQGDEIRYEDHPVSSGGAGFVTQESEAAA
jgi:glutamate synthase domain-containing protein 3